MPKDPKKNVDRYKISGGDLNEFEFHKNQEQFTEQQRAGFNNLIPGTPPEEKAQRVNQLLRKSQQLAKKKTTKAATTKGASAKKLAARKAAKK
jgi:hypothetical protein